MLVSESKNGDQMVAFWLFLSGPLALIVKEPFLSPVDWLHASLQLAASPCTLQACRLRTVTSAEALFSLSLYSSALNHPRKEKQMPGWWQAPYISVSCRKVDNSLGTAVK